MKRVYYLLLLFLSAIPFLPVYGISVIPYPSQMEVLGGEYILKDGAFIYISDDCPVEEKHLTNYLEGELKLKIKKNKRPKASVCLILDEKLHCVEGAYTLLVNEKGLSILASDRAGLFYGIQTLKQLVERDTKNSCYTIPCIQIEDKPRFKWRAMLLDEARTFQGEEVVKELIEELARLKMNKLQWHLTDDQGWRIEIKKYPLLTTVNTELTLSDELQQSMDTVQKKGFYTQEEIKEIVQYAKKHHVTIVPEIEMPGHASAAIAAYPWLGVHKQSIQLPVKEKPVKVTSILLDIFDISDERTIFFLQDVLDEVTSLFPGNVIHIGGDEVNFSQWKESEKVVSFMRKEKIASSAELQRWLTNRISGYLMQKGVRMMGWNDIMGQNLHGYKENQAADFTIKEKLAEGTIVHFWKGDPGLITETAEQGYEVVNAYHVFTYMDYTYQSVSLGKVYSFEPVPEILPVSLHAKIIGLGCQMWGGSVCTIETKRKLYEQIFPRLAAYAEVGWTDKKNKDWIRFQHAMQKMKRGWSERGIYYFNNEEINR